MSTAAMNEPGETVAFQGELGAYSEEALLRHFGGGAKPHPCRTFDEVTAAVNDGLSSFGLIPIENTLAGTVVGGLDALASSDLVVVGEVIRPIRHCLLAPHGATMAVVAKALSHPVALAQCQDFFSEHTGIEPVVTYDTAGAAREVAALGDVCVAAIAGRRAAHMYDLEVLREDIQDRDDNQTRFLVVAKQGSPTSRGRAGDPAATKVAMIFETANRPGALALVLQPLAEHGVNLTHLHSRPGGTPWTYRFFAEIERSESERQMRQALEAARSATSELRVLGSYAPAPRG